MTKTSYVEAGITSINYFEGAFGFLSNFNGGVEQKFQAAKSCSPEERDRILAMSPGRSKVVGNRIQLRPGWDEMKYQIMENLVRAKFADPFWGEQLLATGDLPLREGNTWHDHIWGHCICVDCSSKGPGLNWLGLILMKVRSELAQGDPKKPA